jgi:cation diffusion facilitator CzcD-associated flavoprotein CzcO
VSSVDCSTHIVILGGGLGGLGFGARLKAAGVRDFLILEQSTQIGGTWRDNTYPGCACDTESHLYCFSFLPNPGVSRLYARQPEILAYAERVATEANLMPHIRLGTCIAQASFDESAFLWNITITDGRRISARHFVAAWGQLNRPQIPYFSGIEDFSGDAFHSARWRHDIDLTGKRVASIGNAASAIQYIPEIARAVAHLDVFQRSPNYIVPRGDRTYTEDERAYFEADETHFAASQQSLFDWRESLFERMRIATGEATALGKVAMEHLATQVPDPALRGFLTPDYAPGCKRILRSDDYYPALLLPQVSLVTQAIDHIVPHGIVTTDGLLHLADVIIYGTGFETHSFQGPVEIFGLGGVSLRDRWARFALAYLGISVDPFPNFYLLYGPNTNLGHNSILSMLEAQFSYIIKLIDRADQTVSGALCVRSEAVAAFDEAVQQQFDGAAWSSSCTSWYKSVSGRVINNWSGTVRQYQQATAEIIAGNYVEAA